MQYPVVDVLQIRDGFAVIWERVGTVVEACWYLVHLRECGLMDLLR